MSDGFTVDPDVMRTVAPTFSAEAAQLLSALQTLRAQLDDCGAPWGQDKAGRGFAAQYLPHRPQIERAVDVLGQGLASVDKALAAMADNQDARERASSIRRPADGGPMR